MSDPGQRGARTGPVVAAVAYLANAAVGTWIAIRNDIPGRPLGIETGLPIALDFTVGLGTGLSAPLILLIALALLAGSVARRGRRRSIFWMGILGWCFLVGMLIEPVLGQAMRGEHGALVMAVVVLNVLLPVLLIGLTVGIIPRVGKTSAVDVVDG
jgi:hypothetical protein